jgi:hypothetical protein
MNSSVFCDVTKSYTWLVDIGISEEPTASIFLQVDVFITAPTLKTPMQNYSSLCLNL